VASALDIKLGGSHDLSKGWDSESNIGENSNDCEYCPANEPVEFSSSTVLNNLSLHVD
jgi:hypothetical protein